MDRKLALVVLSSAAIGAGLTATAMSAGEMKVAATMTTIHWTEDGGCHLEGCAMPLTGEGRGCGFARNVPECSAPMRALTERLGKADLLKTSSNK